MDIPILNYLPEKYRGTAMLLILVFPYITRAYHAIATGGGLVGVWKAILYGTNVDPKVTANVQQILDAVQNGQQVIINRAVEDKPV